MYSSRSEFVYKNIDWNKELKILDIGFIGSGKVSEIHKVLKKNLKISDELYGMDVNDKIFNFRNTDNVKYIKKSIFDKNNEKMYAEYFDYIVLCEVFEHLENPYMSLEIIKKMLKSDGILLMTYPNPISWRKIIRYIFTRNILTEKYLKIYAGANDHKIFPFPSSIANYFKFLNMEVKYIFFMKNIMAKIPFFNKLSDYICLVVKKN